MIPKTRFSVENFEPHSERLMLSPREKEIIRLVAIGYPNKTIAGVLDISPWTVATHVRRIFSKIGVHGRAAMIAKLAQSGFSFDHRSSESRMPSILSKASTERR